MIFAAIAFVAFISLLIAAGFGSPALHTVLNTAGLLVLIAAPTVAKSRVSRLPMMSQPIAFSIAALASAALSTNIEWLPILSLFAVLLLVYPFARASVWLERRIGPSWFVLACLGVLTLAWLAATAMPPAKPGAPWLRNVPIMESFGVEFRKEVSFLPLIWFCALLAGWVMSNVFDSSVGRSIVVSDIDNDLARSFGIERERHLLAYHLVPVACAILAGWLFSQWAREVGIGIVSPLMVGCVLACMIAGMFVGPWGTLPVAGVLAWLIGPASVGRDVVAPISAVQIAALALSSIGVVILWKLFAPLNTAARRLRRWVDPHYVDLGAVDERSGMKGQGAPPPGTELVAFDHVSFGQSDAASLSEVSFAVSSGESVGFTADTPQRRHTLLALLSGHLRPGAGTVVVWSDNSARIARHDWVRHGIARTFAPPRLIAEFPVIDNVTVGASARLDLGVAPALVRLNMLADRTLRSEAMFHLSRIWMREYAEEMPRDLSVARAHLVELARALTADPALVVLDHPSQCVGNTPERETVVGLVKDLIDAGLAVIVVDNDVSMLRELVKTLHVIDGGKVTHSGGIERVLAQTDVRLRVEAFR